MNLTELLHTGGPMVSILAVLSVIVVTLILMKLFQFTWLNAVAPSKSNVALEFWLLNNEKEAIKSIEGSKSPIDKVLLTAFSAASQSYNDINLLKEELSRQAINELVHLRSYLKAIDVIANLSPLLGLLGTVMGMIESFQQMEIAGSKVDPSILSGGIWVALITTAMGMAIAIPAVAMHSYFERKVEAIKHQMENAITLVFTKDIVVAHTQHQELKITKQFAHAN